MRLLLDNNLSPRLIGHLANLFLDMTHVAVEGLERATDEEVWEYARIGGLIVITKDTDFADLSALRGSPPKVIWMRIGNCPTARIEALLREHHTAITAFAADPTGDILVLVDG